MKVKQITVKASATPEAIANALKALKDIAPNWVLVFGGIDHVVHRGIGRSVFRGVGDIEIHGVGLGGVGTHVVREHVLAGIESRVGVALIRRDGPIGGDVERHVELQSSVGARHRGDVRGHPHIGVLEPASRGHERTQYPRARGSHGPHSIPMTHRVGGVMRSQSAPWVRCVLGLP